jgi:hypothetical protein
MRTSTLWLLARPSTVAGRSRGRLVAAGTAVAGALLLTAVAVLRVPSTAPTWSTGASPDPRFSPLVGESGLKPGVMTGVLLLLVPALALSWQAVTTGSARRATVQEGLRLAGATPGDLRRVAAVEPALAGLLGGLLAGPGYLLLWLLFGSAARPGTRLLPDLSWADVLAWAAVIALTSLVGAAAGAWSVGRRPRRPARAWPRLLGIAAGVGAVRLALNTRVDDPGLRTTLTCAALSLFLLSLLSSGSLWVTWRARRLARTGRPVDLLAAGGLRTLNGPAGRTAGTVLVVGVVLGFAAALLGFTVGRQSWAIDPLPGMLLTVLAGALAVGVALAAVALAAVDDLVTSSRALASTAALGAEPAVLEGVQRRRLEVVTVQPMAAGLLLGGLLFPGLAGSGVRVAVVLLTAVVVLAGTRALTIAVLRALRPRVQRAADPSSLRTA